MTRSPSRESRALGDPERAVVRGGTLAFWRRGHGGVPLLLVRAPPGLMYAAVAAVAGFLLPGVLLGRLIDKRRLAITNGLPDVLDLLIVCLEAGSSLDQAIVKANEELSLAHPALGEELRMLSSETRAGKPRIEAFKNLEARTKNDDVRALVAMLVQTDRFGTSVSQALRTFAEVARTRRRHRCSPARRQAARDCVAPLAMTMFLLSLREAERQSNLV